MALDDEDYEGMNQDSSVSHNESVDVNSKPKTKGVRFASIVDDNELALPPSRTNFQ